jgi:hypothetical protein
MFATHPAPETWIQSLGAPLAHTVDPAGLTKRAARFRAETGS